MQSYSDDVAIEVCPISPTSNSLFVPETNMTEESGIDSNPISKICYMGAGYVGTSVP